MTASQKAKELGCKSLVDVSEKTKVSVQTLRNWHYERPEAFRAVCYAVAMGYQP